MIGGNLNVADETTHLCANTFRAASVVEQPPRSITAQHRPAG